MNQELFRYPNRAFICSILGILAVLMIEALSVYYVLCFSNVLDIINNFIKLKILASFDDFFVEPFKQSSMRGFINLRVSIKKFRKDKIVIGVDEIKEIVSIKKYDNKAEDLKKGKEGEGVKYLVGKVEELEVELQKQSSKKTK